MRARSSGIHEAVLLAFTAIAVGVGWLAVVLQPPVVAFRPLGLAEVAHLMIPVFLLAVFVERVLEVFLTAWRGAGAADLKERVRLGYGMDKWGRLPARRLRAYKSQTRRIALIGGTALGVALALAGVRILQPLLDPPGAAPGWQRAALTSIDVLLTGALLGGGSHGVHRVMKAVTDLVEAGGARPGSLAGAPPRDREDQPKPSLPDA